MMQSGSDKQIIKKKQKDSKSWITKKAQYKKRQAYNQTMLQEEEN